MRIILCVTSDIVTDQRVNRIALSLLKLPAELSIIGVRRKKSLPTTQSRIHYKRFNIWFQKGPLFYMEYNIRLFIYLLFSRARIVVANDLDTLPAVYAACSIRRIPVVYDSHEYFTGLPELVDRPHVKKVWQRIEGFTLPHIRYAYTVSDPIANVYMQKYGISMSVIRNIPLRIPEVPQKKTDNHRAKLIIYQGALNMGRGLESAIRAMKYMSNCKLLIAGSGYLDGELKKLSQSEGVSEKVHFTGLVLPDELVNLTLTADLGISLEENRGLNYQYALPNKVFDYIQARVPVLVSDLPEMSALVRFYDVGMVADTTDPLTLAGLFQTMLYDEELNSRFKARLEEASAELCWENEEPGLLEIYRQVIRDLASSKAGK